MSLSAPKEEKGNARFRKPFRCFFCRGTIGHVKPYLRLPHPKGMKAWNGKPKMLYLHGDGAGVSASLAPARTTSAPVVASGLGRTSSSMT